MACSARPPDPATVYHSIQADFIHGALDVARARTEQARVDFSRADAAGTDWPMQFRLLEADILTYQGRREQVLSLLTAPGLPDAVGDAAIKRDLLLGLAHYGTGQPALSATELRAARTLAQSSNSPLMGEVLLTEGLVQLNDNKLTDALDSLKRSLALARARGDAFLELRDLLNIGFVTSHQGQYDAAVPLLSDAAKYADILQAQTAIQVAQGNLGEIYLRLGDFDKAVDNYSKAEALAEKIGATRNQIDWLQWMGVSFYKLGNLEQAKVHYERALSLATTLHDTLDIVQIDSNLAFVELRQGNYDAASSYSEAAIQMAPESPDADAAAAPRFLQATLAARQKRFDEAERQLLAIHQKAPSDDVSFRWDVENALAKLYTAKHQPDSAQSWFRRSIDTFEAQRDALNDESLKLSFFANGESLYRDYADFLIDSGRAKEALQLLDRGRARTLQDGLAVTDKELQATLRSTVEAQSVARRLDACILFYALGPERSYLWAITAQRTEMFVLPPQADIEALIQQYQKAVLRSTDPLREKNSNATALYQRLVAPAAAMIPAGSRVFLIRDGALNGLNFETLLAPSGTGLQYWIETVTVANANSIRLLWQRSRSVSVSPRGLLMLGDALSSGAEYEKLANAAVEIDDVEKHFNGEDRTVLTNTQAVPAAYAASHPDLFSYIHFAAHGTASRLSPLDSAVVLSPPANDPDGFKLYARDILKVPLHARLVTVSACYGSGLRSYAGEGMVGLAWAFLRAGSHDVIAALWEVNDASTSILMDRLYAGIEQGRIADTALRAAKLTFIHSDGVYRKPFYWGAFELYAGS